VIKTLNMVIGERI